MLLTWLGGGGEVDGLQSYVVAWSACGVQGIVFGLIDCLPTLFGSILSDSTMGKVTPESLSLVLGVASALQQIFSIFAGHTLHVVGARVFCGISMALCFLSFYFASCCASSSSDLLLMVAIPYGAAMGFMLTPGSTACSSWFRKKRSLAQGIVFSGGGFGPSIIAPVAGAWVSTLGWRATMRRLSFFGIGGVVFLFALRERPSSAAQAATAGKADREEDDHPLRGHSIVGGINIHTTRLSVYELITGVCTSTLFLSFFVSCFFFAMSFYSFLYLAVPYAASMGSSDTVYSDSPTISIDSASTLMTFFGVAFSLGSLFNGWHGHHAGDDSLFTVSTLMMGMIAALSPMCRNYAAFAVCYSIYGFFSAGVWATLPSLLVDAFKGPNLGNLMSAALTSMGVAAIIAPYLQSSLVASRQGDYTIGLMIMAVSSALSALTVSFAFSKM